ncbi:MULTISPECIES: phage virion morphogenesis protein [unclassified Acinetobacter]|uniref:phage virion morphogenesis protein n=1 Tax=unclassified Acinetobacter TaxID=196816 RepID=UPI00190C2E99|nr:MULTISPECIES: phage virion morphogenesis protein [unclassified Acinetobacter]MBK0062392.1 phage virion morphogenesis protein [Acinetobacter sp. S55]MBK0066196.1 phage virion morphogenesis protein [Acinetobacter sp. S54]
MQIVIDDSELQQKLNHAAQKLSDTTPLMRSLSLSLLNVTEENFAAQGRPAWAALKNPREGGLILQKSGQLAASVTPFHGVDHAGVGSNKVYAAIHHLGGKTKPHIIKPKNKKALAFGGGVYKQVNHPGSNIPARPYLPMDGNGNLQREAQEEIEDVIDVYLKNIF